MIKKILTTFACLWAFACTANAQVSQVYAFGDSLSDTGNMFRLTNGYLPRAPYFSGHYTNGSNWAEYLTRDLGLPSTALHDYAYGAARTSSDLPPGLLSQVQLYITESPSADPDGLYLIWAGANDYMFNSNPNLDDVKATVANIRLAIENLANRGARYFVVMNIPDMGVTPWSAKAAKSTRDPGFQAEMSKLTRLHNKVLRSEMMQLSSNFLSTGLPVAVFQVDVWSYLADVLVKPAEYGLENVTVACYTGNYLGNYGTTCTDPEKHLFWDDAHPTTTVHALLAERARETILGYHENVWTE